METTDTTTDPTPVEPAAQPALVKSSSKRVGNKIARNALLIWLFALAVRVAYNALAVHPLWSAEAGAALPPDSSDTWLWLTNAVFESFSCLLVYLAGTLSFGRKAGLVAGVVLAVYPPSIFATRYWSDRSTAALCVSVGLLLFAYLARNFSKQKVKSLVVIPMCLIAAAITFLCSQIPSAVVPDWSAASLEQSLSGPAVAYGNSLEYDGWVPADPAVSPVVRADGSDAAALIGLELRKIGRLIGGAWNDFSESVVGEPAKWADCFHQLVLFFALVGFLAAVLQRPNAGESRFRKRRNFLIYCSGLVCFAAAACHLAFAAGQPIASAFYTAMPPLVMLAGYGIFAVFRKGVGAVSVVGCLLVIAVVAAWSQGFSFVPWLASVLSGGSFIVASWLDGLFWSIIWILLIRLILAVVAPSVDVNKNRSAVALWLGASLLVSVVIVAICVSDPSRHQWIARLEGQGEGIRQDVYIPPAAGALSLSAVSFVLIDTESAVLSPKLRITVNGLTAIYPAVPWLQVNNANHGAMRRISTWAAQSDRDLRSMHQWWAFAIPTAWVRFGATNEITVSGGTPSLMAGHTVYGDYNSLHAHNSANERVLPSFDVLSIARGFQTQSRGDARIPQPRRILSRFENSYWYDINGWRAADLSGEPGIQRGEYRLRIAIPQRKSGDTPSSLLNPAALAIQSLFPPVVVVDANVVKGVAGSDPGSTRLTKSPVPLPPILPPGSLFSFTAEINGYQPKTLASIDIEFSGKRNGQPVKWHSLWDPAAAQVGNEWYPLTVCDTIPDEVLSLENLTVSVTAVPYPDYLARTKPGQADSSSMIIRNAQLVILPPLDVAPAESRQWLLY
jgi:hypothetical protein